MSTNRDGERKASASTPASPFNVFARTLLRRLGLDVRRYRSDLRMKTESEFALQALMRGVSAPCIVDVGANHGQSAERYLRWWPAARIHCVEPGTSALEALERKYGSDPRVRIHPAALTDREGPVEFHPALDDQTSSLHPGKPEARRFGVESLDAIKVAGTTLDAMVDREGLDHIHLLKIDVQGGEASVLKGARNTLRKRSISLVYAEVLFASLYEGQTTFGGVSDLLTGEGFELFSLYDLSYPGGRLSWADALFVGPAMAART